MFILVLKTVQILTASKSTENYFLVWYLQYQLSSWKRKKSIFFYFIIFFSKFQKVAFWLYKSVKVAKSCKVALINFWLHPAVKSCGFWQKSQPKLRSWQGWLLPQPRVSYIMQCFVAVSSLINKWVHWQLVTDETLHVL